jgi:hypothetical protein
VRVVVGQAVYMSGQEVSAVVGLHESCCESLVAMPLMR